jgi:primosomal protein N' (replication factor Y)
LSGPADAQLPRTVSVALPLPLRRAFTYAVPDSLPMPAPGVRVRVPLSERVLTGVVLESPAPPASVPGTLRDVLDVLDDEPVCLAELLTTAARVADRFFASTGEVLKSALPARLPASGSVRYRITERGALAGGPGFEASASPEERGILERLAGGESVRVIELPGPASRRRDALRGLEERGFVRAVSAAKPKTSRVEVAYAPGALTGDARERALGRSRRAREALDYLESLGRPATAAEARLAIGVSTAILRSMAAKGLLRTFEQTRRAGEAPVAPPRPPVVPTPPQAEAIEAISSAVREGR